MIKAIIFDCFGVILTGTWAQFRDTHFIHDDYLLQRADEATRAVDLGLISREDYRETIAELSGLTLADVVELLEKGSDINVQLLEFIRMLKKNYKVGMLSSVAPNRLEQFLTVEQRGLFDAVVLSHEIGYVKPEPQAYQIAADRLGVMPEECIFVDDQERNITGAQEVGMRALHYKNFIQFEHGLKELLK